MNWEVLLFTIMKKYSIQAVLEGKVKRKMEENKKTIDVTALGELLVDFTMNGQSEQGNLIFEACPGGAPCNVLAFLQKMEKKTAFIGKVGNDQFGKMLKETIEEAGINVSNLIFDNQVNTTLAFVHTFENGDRDFSFYRNPGADMMLTAAEINEEVLLPDIEQRPHEAAASLSGFAAHVLFLLFLLFLLSLLFLQNLYKAQSSYLPAPTA